MCGPSSQETSISQEQSDFYKTLTDEYSTVFGQNQAILGNLTSAFTPILQAGPSQTGYSPSQANALNTQATEKVATDYAQAQRATAQTLAGQGGGNTFLPSSVNANLLANNANAAAAERANLQNKNLVSNYQQGYANWNTAANVLGTTASQYNPNAYSSSASGAGQQAFGSASQMSQEQFQPWGAALSTLGSVGGMALGGYLQGRAAKAG